MLLEITSIFSYARKLDVVNSRGEGPRVHNSFCNVGPTTTYAEGRG